MTENSFVNFLVLNLSPVGSTSSACLQWDQLSTSKIIVLFGSKGGPTGWGSNSIAYPL